jgi:hypothetical protein
MFNDKGKREEKDICPSEPRPIVRFDGGISEEPECDAPTRRMKVGITIVCGIILLLLIYVAIRIAMGNNMADEVNIDATESTNAWRGAFDSEKISEASIGASVSVRAGGAGEYGARSASGFVIDSDGWIATSSRVLSGAPRGRIYVIDSEGEEYAVNALFTDRERGVTFLRVEKNRLRGVESLGSDGLCVGEKLISLSSNGAPKHSVTLSVGSFGADSCTVWLGDNIGRREGQMYTDMYFEGSELGSPVFDSGGRIVAMALFDGSGYVTPIEEIVESFRVLT